MNCTDIRPLLSAYYDGDGTPEEHARVESHLAGCEDCRRALAEYRAIGGDLRALPLPVPPAGLRRDVWRAIEAQQAARGAARAPALCRSWAGTPVEKQRARRRSLLSILANIGKGWGNALPAASLIAAVLLIFVVALVVINPSINAQAAKLLDSSQVSNYGQ